MSAIAKPRSAATRRYGILLCCRALGAGALPYSRAVPARQYRETGGVPAPAPLDLVIGRYELEIYPLTLMTSPHTTTSSLREAEYAALRATIRERGSLRLALVPLAFIGWAGVAVGTAAVITVALSTLVPLLVLAAGFEAVFALHVSVERIGRYLQVFHERPGAGWEHAAMAFGRAFPAAAPDPLFGRLFVFATSVNFVPAALGGTPVEILLLAIVHLTLVYRVRTAQRWLAFQREEDLQRFETLRTAMTAEHERTPGQDERGARPSA